MMSYSQSFSNYNFNNNEKADDSSSTVFAADRVVPDEVPSLPPAIQEESPQSFTSVLLRRINSTRHHPTMPSTTTTATVTPNVYDANIVIPGREESTATATASEEISRSNQHQSSSSSSSSKKRPIITNRSSHSSRKKTRQSSRRKRQRSQDQSCVDKSDEEVDDENGVDDDEPDEAVFNQSSSSSQTSTTKLTKHDAKWKSKFEELRAFKQLHGHTSAPKSNKQIGNWVIRQRAEYKKFKANKKAKITKERIQTLESIGFEWASQNKGGQRNESKWNERFNELKDYKEKNDHTNVPRNNKQLGVWVNTQRREYKNFQDNKKAYITPERIQMLESIGFEWVPPNPSFFQRNESAWNKRLNELKAYKEAHGNTYVPQNSKDNKELGTWVNHQRTEYRKLKENKHSCMTHERIDLLNSIGFEWELHFHSEWNKRFNELSAYKEKYGRTNVPRHFKDNKELGVWVSSQRVQYRNFQANKYSTMTPERIDLLNSIGFEWECRPVRAPRS